MEKVLGLLPRVWAFGAIVVLACFAYTQKLRAEGSVEDGPERVFAIASWAGVVVTALAVGAWLVLRRPLRRGRLAVAWCAVHGALLVYLLWSAFHGPALNGPVGALLWVGAAATTVLVWSAARTRDQAAV